MSLILYKLFLILYSAGIRVAALWNPKAGKWVEGRRGSKISDLPDRQAGWRLQIGGNKKDEGFSNNQASNKSEIGNRQSPILWMHCASLGEFEQGRPVIEQLKRKNPEIKIALTFFSPSGYEACKNYSVADFICYLPMDGKQNAAKFIEAINPSVVLWVKYEFWYYYLTELKKRNIPVYLISGILRSNQPFFKWYGNVWRQMLQCFSFLFLQNDHSKKLADTLVDAGKSMVSGDTRFDRVVAIAENFTEVPYIKEFCAGSTTIVIGSSWEEDEQEWMHYVKKHPEITFIIAPHEVGEENIKDVQKEFPGSILYSELIRDDRREMTDDRNKMADESEQTTGDSEQMTDIRRRMTEGAIPVNYHLSTVNCLIIDNIGLLSRLYKYAHITYVGGGFGDDGVHNVLEAAVYGKPVIYGPEYEKYAEAIGLIECGGGIEIENALELEKVIERLLNEKEFYEKTCKAAKEFVHGNAGATGMIVEYITTVNDV